MDPAGKPARALAACLCVLFSLLASPQTQTTGRIAGRVVDQQGATISFAGITIESQATAARRITSTDGESNYSVAALPPGDYQVTFVARGFATATLSVKVSITETTTLDAVLKVAPANAEVTVRDVPQLVQTSGPQIATTIDTQMISTLPMPTRNFLQLAQLAPGVSMPLTNNSAIGRNSPNFSVNGARTSQNNVQINGVDANNIADHSLSGMAVPAPESIQEVLLQTSMYDASMGGAGGGNVQVITRSGTNSVHGSVYEYFRNDALNANDPNLNLAGVARPVLRRNVYGATVGGPIRKDRAFFFLSYQGTRELNGATGNSLYKSVLIAPGLTNDRSPTALLALLKSLDPSTSATTINPIALALLNYKLPSGQFLIPTPQQDDGRASGSALSTYHEEQFNTNFDYRPGPRDSVSAKFFFADTPQFNALGADNVLGAAFGATTLPGFGLQLDNNNRLLSVSYIRTLSATTLNEARFGYNFIGIRGAPQEPLLDSSIGIHRPTADAFPGLPLILLAREAGGATIGSPFATLDMFSSSLSLFDILSLQRGKHSIRLGGELRHYRWKAHANANTYGEIDFSLFSDFLTGNSDFASIGVGLSRRDFRTTDYSFFLEDDWRLSHKFTLNLGLRYELDPPPYDTQGRIGGFDPALYRRPADGSPLGPPLGGIVMAGNSPYSVPDVTRVGKRVVNSIDPNNFAPRLGFAWSPLDSGRWVLRGGYGIFYSPPSFFYLGLDFFAPPFYANYVSTPQTFANPFPDALPESRFPIVPSGIPVSATVLDRNMRTPYFQQFNVSVQYELRRDMLLQVAYVGTRGLRLLRSAAVNQARIVSLNHPIVNQATGEVITVNTNDNASLRAPMQGVDPAFFSLNQSSGQSTYHSLQVLLTRRLSRGLEFKASYTFSKSIDNGSNPGGGALANGTLDTSTGLDTSSILGNEFRNRGNRGVSDFDRTHRFVGYFLWDLPKPAFARDSVARPLLSNWQLSGIVTLMSGLPIDIFDPAGGSLYGLVGARPNWAPGSNRSTAVSNVPHGYYFNPFAFAQAVVQAGQPIPSASDPTAIAGDQGTDTGTVGRNVLRGPGQSNVDLSVLKRIPIKESKTVELRADFFNVFNHANKNNPISDISVVSASGGSFDSNGRIIGPGDFGRIVGYSSSPRIIQLALKLSF